jgi:hypothetical protein
MTSHDGGRTFTDPGYSGQGVHPDQHALWVDPNDPHHLVLGNDGGVSYHTAAARRGGSWTTSHRAVLPRRCRHARSISRVRRTSGQRRLVHSGATRDEGSLQKDAYLVGGGDGLLRADRSHGPEHRLRRARGQVSSASTMPRARRRTSSQVCEQPSTNTDPRSPGTRSNWSSPMLLSSFDPKTVYLGMNVVFRSRDRE